MVFSSGAFQSGSRVYAQSATETIFHQDGQTYVIAKGDVYRVEPSGVRTFLSHLYDPGYIDKNYKSKDGWVYAIDYKRGELVPVVRTFRENFEGLATTQELFNANRWESSTVDPGRAGQPYNYYNLGNRLTVSSARAYTGLAAIRCYAVPSLTEVSKTSLTKGNMLFIKGDDVYISGRFFIENTPSVYDGGGTTLFDLEATHFVGSPGVRLIFRQGDSLAFEMELPKVQFKQDSARAVRFPTGRWVKVDAQVTLSENAAVGRVRIWQDGLLVLDKLGPTLPVADAIYDRFEVGISAIAKGAQYAKTVHVDDIGISTAPL
jgi:hypothetical protein